MPPFTEDAGIIPCTPKGGVSGILTATVKEAVTDAETV